MVLTNALFFAVAYTLVGVRCAALSIPLSIALTIKLSTALATAFSAALLLHVLLHCRLRQQTPTTSPHYNNQAGSAGDLSRSLSNSNALG